MIFRKPNPCLLDTYENCDGETLAREKGRICHFGVTEALAIALTSVGVGTAAAGAASATALSVAGAIVTGAEIGGALSTVSGLAQGKPFGKALIGGLEGAGEGAVTGGLASGASAAVGPLISEATGFGAATSGGIAGGLAGAATGAGFGAASGQNPLIGAGVGAVGGAVQGVSTAGDLATTGAGGTPSIPNSGAPAGAPSGSFTNPSGVGNLATGDINTALNPTSLSGANLSPSTNIGSLDQQAGDWINSAASGSDNASLGPVNFTGGGDGVGAAASGGDGSGIGGGLNLGNVGVPDINPGNVGPTISNAAALPAAASAAPAATSSESGIGSFLTNPKNVPLELGAGYIGLQELQGPPPLPQSAKDLQTQGESLNAQAGAGLAAANSNQLTPGQSAGVQQYISNSMNQLYQQLASSGVANPSQDSRYIAGVQQIQQQAQVMTQNYVQQTFQNAMAEAGQAANDLGAAATAQTTNDTAFSTSISNAVGAIGGMYALNSFEKKAA